MELLIRPQKFLHQKTKIEITFNDFNIIGNNKMKKENEIWHFLNNYCIKEISKTILDYVEYKGKYTNTINSPI